MMKDINECITHTFLKTLKAHKAFHPETACIVDGVKKESRYLIATGHISQVGVNACKLGENIVFIEKGGGVGGYYLTDLGIDLMEKTKDLSESL